MKPRKGYIPPPPPGILTQHRLQYKPANQTLDNPTAIRKGPIRLWKFTHAAGKRGHSAILRLFRYRMFLEQFHEDFIARVELCAAKEVPNGMLHGEPGTRFDMLVIVLGCQPHRIVVVEMDNYIGRVPIDAFPKPGEIRDFGELLFANHGRGTGICIELADAYEKLILENYHVMTVMQFNETPCA